jgi:hypothetical protein
MELKVACHRDSYSVAQSEGRSKLPLRECFSGVRIKALVQSLNDSNICNLAGRLNNGVESHSALNTGAHGIGRVLRSKPTNGRRQLYRPITSAEHIVSTNRCQVVTPSQLS